MGERQVVVGLDNGGTSNNATVLDTSPAASSSTGCWRRRAGSRKARRRRSRRSSTPSPTPCRSPDTSPSDVLAVGLDTPGPASADGVISSKGSTNFGHAGWSHFDVRGALEDGARHPGRLQQRRQRRRPLRPPRALRRRRRAALVGVGHRRHRPRRGGDRLRAGAARGGRDGRRARSHPDPDARPAGGRPADPPLQLRPDRRRRERRLADGDRAQPAPLLADAVPGPRAGVGRPGARRRAGCAASPSAATRWRCASSASRRWRSAGCSRSPPTTATRTPTSSAAASLETEPHFRDWFVEEVSRHTQLRTEQQQASELVIVPGLDCRRRPRLGHRRPRVPPDIWALIVSVSETDRAQRRIAPRSGVSGWRRGRGRGRRRRSARGGGRRP